MKHDDIADTSIFIRDVKNPADLIFQTTLPYFQRVLEADVRQMLKSDKNSTKTYQICLLAKTSKNKARKFYPEQCRELNKSFTSSGNAFKANYLLLSLVSIYCFILV